MKLIPRRTALATLGAVAALATAGTAMPPSAKPNWIEDSARARLRSNQWISATLSGKKPHRLAPSATTRKAP